MGGIGTHADFDENKMDMSAWTSDYAHVTGTGHPPQESHGAKAS